MKIITIITAVSLACLASCSTAQRASLPITLGIKRDGVHAKYTSDGGLIISVDANELQAALIDGSK